MSTHSQQVAQKSQKLESVSKVSQNSPSFTQFYSYISNDSPPEKKTIPKQDSRSRSRDKPKIIKQHKQARNKTPSKNSYQQKLPSHAHRYQPEQDKQPFKQEPFYKTKLCPQYSKGACRKGSACNYAHGERQLRNLPDFKKTKLCIAFKQGKCGKPSSQCKYAHGQRQLRKPVSESRQKQKKKKSRSPPDYRRQRQYKQSIGQNPNMAYMIPSQTQYQPSMSYVQNYPPNDPNFYHYGPPPPIPPMMYNTSSQPPIYHPVAPKPYQYGYSNLSYPYAPYGYPPSSVHFY